MRILVLLFLFNVYSARSAAQAGVNIYDSLYSKATPNHPLWKQLFLPAGLITYGALAIRSHPLQEVNTEYKEEIYLEHQHALFHADNYLQFGPAVAVVGLNLAGVKGEHNLFDASMIYVLSNIFLNSSVTLIKHTSHVQRPDGSDYYSFPSGHSAEVFAGAEFMREEYKNVSPWYGFAGYAVAMTTGFLRMYNNKHWFNDVVAGAGFGIASTRLAYWLYPKIKSVFYKNKPVHALLMPAYSYGSLSLNFIYKL